MVGITGLCGPVVDELLLANVRDHGWDTEQYLSEVLVAGFEESERKTSEEYRKVFARARLVWPCAAPCDVVSTVLVSQKGSECRSCVVVPNDIDLVYTAESCLMSQCRVLK